MSKPRLKRHSPEWLEMMREKMKRVNALRNPPVSDAEYIARLREKCVVTEAGCWEYQGFTRKPPRNYGDMSYRCERWRTHRLSWHLHFGPIPDGMHVLHKCDNPPCCNPDHLRLGTHLENMRECREKDRYHYAKLTHCKHGHEFTPENTYYIQGGHLRACKACQRVRQRMRLGWTREQAETLPVTPHGDRPVAGTKRNTGRVPDSREGT